MKTVKFLSTLVAVCALVIGCAKESSMYLDEIQLSSSYITISPNGGDAKITVNAKTDWTFDIDVPVPKDSLSAEKGIVKYTENQKQMDVDENNWVTVSPRSGAAGKTDVVFHADAASGSHVITVRIKAGEKYQYVVISQTEEAKERDITPLSDVVKMTSADDGTVLRVKGSCTAVANTSYGNFYIQDEAGNEVYIYGTVDESGSYNWSKFDIAKGDEVIVEGPYSNYKGTHELVDATFIKRTKAIIESKDVNKTVEMEAEPFTITITQKGTGLVAESQCEWISLENGYSCDKDGNLVFIATPTENNTGKYRTGDIKFVSTKIEKDDTLSTVLMVSITQLGSKATKTGISAINEVIKDASSKEPGFFDVNLADAVVTYVNGDNAYVEDTTGGMLFYGVGMKVGQKINGRVYGQGYAYNGLPEVTKIGTELAKVTTLEEAPQPAAVTLSELAANYDKYMSRYIKISGVKAGEKIDVTYKKVNSKGKVTDGTNSIEFNHVSTGKYNGDKIYYYIQVGQDASIDVTCVPSVYKTTKQLNIYEQKWISEVN